MKTQPEISFSGMEDHFEPVDPDNRPGPACPDVSLPMADMYDGVKLD